MPYITDTIKIGKYSFSCKDARKLMRMGSKLEGEGDLFSQKEEAEVEKILDDCHGDIKRAEVMLRNIIMKYTPDEPMLLSQIGAPFGLTYGEMTALDHWDMRYWNISDISYFSQMKQLKYLDLSGTEISSIKPLETLNNIIWLNIAETDVADLSPLKGMTKLEYFDCQLTEINDISVLKGLKNLKKLNIFNTILTGQQIAELQKALPNCEISYKDDFYHYR